MNEQNEIERVAWIQANFSASDAELLIVSGKAAGQIALDALNGCGPMPVIKGKPNGSGSHTGAQVRAEAASRL